MATDERRCTRIRIGIMAAVAVTGAFGADWLTDGGDPTRSNWQTREKTLRVDNVKGLKLLWKRELDERAVSAPVILGPIVTHRGIKELVLVEGASNTIYAIDADLGKTFWTRRIDGAECMAVPATPVITPEHFVTEEDGEGHTPVRPIYVAAGDGMRHLIRPTTGDDVGKPVKLAAGCSAAINVKPFAVAGTASFTWKGRNVGVSVPAKNVATWETGAGARWVYGSTAAGIQAWTYDGNAFVAGWVVGGLASPVIANGMVFALGGNSLHVLDALTGKELYASDTVAMPGASLMALANGHISFTAGKVVYCFGLPIEI